MARLQIMIACLMLGVLSVATVTARADQQQDKTSALFEKAEQLRGQASALLKKQTREYKDREQIVRPHAQLPHSRAVPQKSLSLVEIFGTQSVLYRRMLHIQ